MPDYKYVVCFSSNFLSSEGAPADDVKLHRDGDRVVTYLTLIDAFESSVKLSDSKKRDFPPRPVKLFTDSNGIERVVEVWSAGYRAIRLNMDRYNEYYDF